MGTQALYLEGMTLLASVLIDSLCQELSDVVVKGWDQQNDSVSSETASEVSWASWVSCGNFLLESLVSADTTWTSQSVFWTLLPSLVFCEFPALIAPRWSRKDHVRGQYTSIPIARKWRKNHRQPQCTGQGVTDGWVCGYLLWPSFYNMIFEHISWWRCTIKNSLAICSFLFYLAWNNMAHGSFHCMRLPTHQ